MNNAIGRDAVEYIDSLLTDEELAESNLRVSQLKMVEITVTIPKYLDDMATARGLDLSKVLQEALIEKLGISL